MQPESTMWDQITTFFLSAFRYPGVDPGLLILGVALGVAFGFVWLIAYRPRLPGPRGLLLLAAASALGTWAAIAFVQLPLQAWWEQGLMNLFGQATVLNWLLVVGAVTVLISGLVQEGAKLASVVAYRSLRHVTLDARTGLLLGVIAGAGFGVFEAVWVHNSHFAAGLDWQAIQADPFAVLPFVERFLAVGIHIALSAIAGYGLAKGMGWRFLLLAGGLHGVANYVSVLQQAGVLGTAGVELYITVFTVIASVATLRVLARVTEHPGRGPSRASDRLEGFGQPA